MSKPDFDLKISKRGDKYGSYVGAAWKNKAGGINIKINPGVSIQSGEDIDVTLWPKRDRDGGNGGGAGYQGGGRDDFGDDDVPFATCSVDDSARLIGKVRV